MSEFFIVPNPLPVGGHVGQLQQALQLLAERGVLLPDDEKLRRELCDAMKLEQLGQVLGTATRKLLSIFQEKRRLKVSGILDAITADALNRLLAELLGVNKDERGFSVKGKVSFADGFAAPSVHVVAVDLDLRSEEILGRATTGRDGEYEIRYSPGQFRRLDKGNADLRVRALRADGTELAVSAILFNAPAESVVDLTIDAGEAAPSLFERIAAALQPALGNLGVRELEEDDTHQDLTFLAGGEARFERPMLARYAITHRLAQRELPPEFWFALLGGSLFTYDPSLGLGEQAQTILANSLSLDATAVRRSLTSAFAAKELPEALREHVPAWTERFLQFAASRAVSDDRPSFLKDVVRDAGLPPEKGEKFARLFTEMKTAPAVLDAIARDPSFQPAEVADLRTSFRLADLTGSDFSVVRAIKTAFDVHEPEQIVGQLEIAGFFQEDDGDLAILHVFGRTRGAEPHLYYYRRYDYRQWSPWEAVELEIRGDYLIPAVVNKRLFLFWPIFTEVPDEKANEKIKLPKTGDADFTPDQTKKTLKLEMAVSDYRQGKWTPKRVSTDAAFSPVYTGEIQQKHYTFFPIDRTGIDGRFGIMFGGSSIGAGKIVAELQGAFEIGGCRGVPELASFTDRLFPAILPERLAVEPRTVFAKWVEQSPGRRDNGTDFALQHNGGIIPAPRTESSTQTLPELFSFARPSGVPILRETPGIFSIAPPWHLSYMDRLLVDGMQVFPRISDRQFSLPAGTWLPFFYADKRRTFFVPPVQPIVTPRQHEEVVLLSPVLPTLPPLRRYLYYPEVRNNLRALEKAFEQTYTKAVGAFDMTSFAGNERRQLDLFLYTAFPLEAPAPLPDDPTNPVPRYTAGEIAIAKSFMVRWWMRYIHLYLAGLSLQMLPTREWHFKNFYHPFVGDFAKLVNDPLKGIPGLMDRRHSSRTAACSSATCISPLPPSSSREPTRTIRRKRSTSLLTAPTRPTTGSCSSTSRC